MNRDNIKSRVAIFEQGEPCECDRVPFYERTSYVHLFTSRALKQLAHKTGGQMTIDTKKRNGGPMSRLLAKMMTASN